MRDELHLMELVDRYLDGGMEDAERSAFEARIADNAELHALVDDQRALREGLQRVRLRGALASAHRRWTFTRWLPGAAAGIILIVGVGWWLRPSEKNDTLVTGPETLVKEVPMNALSDDEAVPPDTLDLSTRVESVFMTTQKVARQVADTGRGEGRIVTRLIKESGMTPETVHVEPGTAASAPRIGEPTSSSIETVQQGAEDRRAAAAKVDSAEAGMAPSDAERTFLARVEHLQNATKPEYPGGMEEMQRFLESNLKQPRGSRKAGIVTVGFTVNKKGEVVNAEVIQSLGRAFDAEALRVVSCMPMWQPSVLGERPVKSKVQVRVRFEGVPRKRSVIKESR